MAELTIDDLGDKICQRLCDRATLNHRSLEAELCVILERAALV